MYFKALVFHGQPLQLLVQRHYQEEKIMEYSIVLVRKSRHEKENLDLLEKSQPLLYIMAFHNSKRQNQNGRRSATRNNIQTI